MAATIKTTLTDNSKEWVDALKARFIEGGGAAEDFEGHLEQLNQELSSREAAKTTTAIKKLADELETTCPIARALGIAEDKVTDSSKRMGKAIDGAGYDAAAAAKQLDRYRASAERAGAAAGAASKPASSLGKITASGVTAVATAGGAVVIALKAMVEGGKKAYQVISMLADTSPGFAKLKAGIDGLGSSALTAGERFAATDFGSKSIKFATDRLEKMGQGLEALPTMWQDLRTIGQSTMATIEGGLGLETRDREKIISLIQQETMEIEAKLAAMKKEAAVAMSRRNAAIVRAADAKSEADAAMLADVERLNGTNQIMAAIVAEQKALKAKEDAGEVTEEAARASMTKTAALRAKLHREEAERQSKTKAYEAEQKAKFEADEAAKVATAKKTEAEITAAEKKELEERRAAHLAFLKDQVAMKAQAAEAAKQAEAQAADAAKQAAAEKFKKKVDNFQGSAAGLLQSQDPSKVAQQVGANRKKQAMDAFGKQNAPEFKKLKAASDSLKDELNSDTLSPDERKRLTDAKRFNDRKMMSMKQEQRKVGMAAHGQGVRDAVRGNVSDDEVLTAQQGLANKVIDHGRKTGQLNQSQADALRAATDVLIKQEQDLRATQDDLNQTKRTLQQLMFNGNGHNKSQSQGT